MKNFVLAALLTLTASAYSAETLKGTFPLNNSQYELSFSYDLKQNQIASHQGTRIYDSVTIPDTNETFPPFCYFDMKFPVSYSVKIKNITTEEIVYTKSGVEEIVASAYGGLVSENQCVWNVASWENKVAGFLRITELAFELEGKSYRYFMDTYSMISAKGSADNIVVAKDSMPLKGNDGRKDGEVWIDTQPIANGYFERTYFPLSL